MSKIDTKDWKEFRVGDLFTAVRGKSRTMQQLVTGKTPIIAAARYNQGIAGYYDVPEEYANLITVSCNGVGCGSTFYHDYPFAVTGDAIVLKEKVMMSNPSKQFIATIYDKYFTSKYSYENKCSSDKAEAALIKLPCIRKIVPDYNIIESISSAPPADKCLRQM